MTRVVPRRATARHRQAAFGLLEALVALVVLASTGMALFGWVNTNLQTVQRLRDRDRQEALRDQMSAWAQTVNPAMQPEGEAILTPGVMVRWTAHPVLPMASVPPFPGGTSTPFQVGLFLLDLSVSGQGIPADTSLVVRRLGVLRSSDEPPLVPADDKR